MALRPRDAYPGQTGTIDAGYPHGKAQNISVPGDGTGTPLEAAWVNDQWGFLQALLEAGEIAPSGQPDMVGASDYLNALRAVIAGFLRDAHTEPEFLNKVYEWTGAHGFHNSLGIFGRAVLGGTSELEYGDDSGTVTPRERIIRVPLSTFCAESINTGDSLHPTGLPGWNIRIGNTLDDTHNGWAKNVNHNTGLYGEVVLPTGARLVKIVARVEGTPLFDEDSSIQISTGLVQIEGEFLRTRTVEKASGPLNGSTLLEVTAEADLPWLNWFDAKHQTLLVRFTGVGAIVMNWVQVTFLDPGPRNF